MTSTIIYLGDLRTQAVHQASGAEIITDAPIDNHGKGEAFSPTDIVCTALASCMLTIMGIAANTHNINITGTQVSVNKIMNAAPRKISKIELSFTMKGQDTYDDKERKILELAARTCPVSLSLHSDVIQEINFTW